MTTSMLFSFSSDKLAGVVAGVGAVRSASAVTVFNVVLAKAGAMKGASTWVVGVRSHNLYLAFLPK